MLKDFEHTKTEMTAKERKNEIGRLRDKLAAQQTAIRDAKLPVIVLVEGWAAAGKGGLINELISELDPRFFSVFSLDAALPGAERYPFLYPFFNAIPEDGKLLFMDSGWMEDTVRRHIRREITDKEYERRVGSIRIFERQLRDNGYVVIRLFLHISEKEQKKRLEKLLASRDTEWRVSEADRFQHREYKRFRSGYESFMEETGPESWNILDGDGKKNLLLEALRLVTDSVDAALQDGKTDGEPAPAEFPLTDAPMLADADLTACISSKDYKIELKKLQKRLAELHNVIYRKRIPVVVCYEGWDAAGKGGSIRRLAFPLDPRGFDVFPIASPEPHELARHYLWRFWKRLPRSGHVAIFDRTWYGRVMVERIEGFCSENAYKRAYTEINEFERDLCDWGAVVLKFWIHIDPDTQLQRFTDRQNTPEKQWKITEEDWRNREKWPQYEQAVQEMLLKTSTEYAPWHIIESVDKKYARIKVLKIVINALEKAVEANTL